MSYKPLYFLPLLPRFTSSSSLFLCFLFQFSLCFFPSKKIASKSGCKLLYESSETMRLENSKKNKLPWPKTLVKKWFNTKTKAQDFHADDVLYRGVDEDWKHKHKFSKRETFNIKKSKTEKLNKKYSDSQFKDIHDYRVFVATWNVAGKSPPSCLDLEDWLHTSPPADIYVLGFQEIVPLNAGNVLGTEDNGPARKWLALIRKTLNSNPGTRPVTDPLMELDADFDGSMRRKTSFQSMRPSDCDTNSRWGSSESDDETDSPVNMQSFGESFAMQETNNQNGHSRYCLAASKQMVGIFLTVWVKNDLRDNVRDMKVSCVGRGLMGYLGNKGSISISMSLHQTSFCFVCSHLTSGQKDGDELRRNSDVMEILKKTRFPRVHGVKDEKSPQTILDHDRIIWLGDLNYRIALSYGYAKALVEMRDWKALLENDQLRIEQRQGRVFEGWSEGKIYFPPTYKYSYNSDRYAVEVRHPKEKRRTPAWCDRILWYGTGLYQLSYVRGESKFSDHRPVYSVFSAKVESINRSRIRKSMSCSGTRIEVEELLPH
ncbi:type I inositol polyphosphate 5-phosphatase 4 [Gossypium raimondii]|nr:type I inositol polyphosphate 5-phosphatase 4 [Gossypium raimondii]